MAETTGESELLAQLKNQQAVVKDERLKREIAALPQDHLEADIVSMENRLAQMLPSTVDSKEAVRIVHRTLELVRSTRGLAECGPTILGGVMTCTQLGLELGVNALGEAYLIPMRNKGRMEATLIIGYKGFRKLVWQSGMVKTMSREIVYENDFFKYRKGLNRDLQHEPAEKERGGVRGYYAVVELMNGGQMWDYFTYEDAVAFRDNYAMAKNGGAWKSNFHEMALKTILKRVLLECPMSIEDKLLQAAHLDGSVRYIHHDDHEDPTKLDPGTLLNRSQLEEAFRNDPDTIDGESVPANTDDGITDAETVEDAPPVEEVDQEDVAFILKWCNDNGEKPLDAVSSAIGVTYDHISKYSRTEIKEAVEALKVVSGQPQPAQ